MNGYCPFCEAELEVGFYAETCRCPVCGNSFHPENLLREKE